ncbi:transcription antitermination factor NusB [Mycoplasma sp. 394]
MAVKNISRHALRIKNIEIIYKHELLDIPYNLEAIINEFQINFEQKLFFIKVKNSVVFVKKILQKLLNEDWPWQRLSPLIRAILINACVELYSIQPKIVINEAVIITKEYFGQPSKSYKTSNDELLYQFVNAILENFYKAVIVLDSESRNAN